MKAYNFEFGDLPFFGKSQAINDHLARAARRLARKLEKLAPKLRELGVSTYGQRYMDTVFGSSFRRFYSLTKYGHLLSHALDQYAPEDLKGLSLADYGGGHGTLSLLAREAGIGTVIHSEIFATSSRDTQLIARALGTPLARYILGDTDDFRRQMEQSGERADIIANYDVLEHIYNFRQYFIDLAAVTKPGGRWYMGSGANLYNEEVRTKLLKVHQELEGCWGDGNESAYIAVRARHIRERAPDLLDEEVERLARATRGWFKADIDRAVDIYISSGHVVEYAPAEINTSNPLNGNWGENMVPIETFTESPVLRKQAKSISIEPSAVWNAFIERDAAESRRWRALSKADAMEALRHAPYYCLSVRF